MSIVETLAWDTYARQRPERRPVNEAGEVTWFNWTQYPEHGPGMEVLGVLPGHRVLDLGCGKGGNLAHLARNGVRTVGVDVSPAQLQRARERWGLLGLSLHRQDAVDFLTSGGAEDFDSVFSVFGAVWFTDPVRLLPAIRARLRTGGVLAFSQRPPVEGCYGCQASYINRGEEEDPLVVKRWDYEPEDWHGLLTGFGFRDVRTQLIPPPPGRRKIGTLLVRAVA